MGGRPQPSGDLCTATSRQAPDSPRWFYSAMRGIRCPAVCYPWVKDFVVRGCPLIWCWADLRNLISLLHFFHSCSPVWAVVNYWSKRLPRNLRVLKHQLAFTSILCPKRSVWLYQRIPIKYYEANKVDFLVSMKNKMVQIVQ